jgi:AcrR family transcriptional regulator
MSGNLGCMGSLRVEQKIKTKERLLRSAFELFSLGGLLATKTLDIAKAANISHGAVFAHFPTKEALLAAVIDEFGLQLGAELQKEMQELTLESVLKTHIRVLEKWEPFYRQLVIGAPHLPESLRVMVISIQSGVAYYLQQAIAQEGIRLAVPLHILLNTWLGLIHYYLENRELFVTSGSLLAAKGQELTYFFLKIIKGVSL